MQRTIPRALQLTASSKSLNDHPKLGSPILPTPDQLVSAVEANPVIPSISEVMGMTLDICVIRCPSHIATVPVSMAA